MLPESGCHIWMGTVINSGYGHIRIYGKTKLAHRASWEAKNGSIPKGQQVLHKCDVKLCINPNHLFTGSQKENMADMHNKGRSAGGVKVGHKHSTETIIKIKHGNLKFQENKRKDNFNGNV